MDLKQLEYFKAVIEEGNISSAAKKLHLSQPPLSHQMKLLEEEFGVRLFERGARKIVLTEAGRFLYNRAKHLLELAEVTAKELTDMGDGLRGTLSLGTISSSGTALLSNRMITFHRNYPDIHFEIHEGNTFELLELLQNGLIEIAIVRTPFQAIGLEQILLEPEPMVAVGSPEYFENAAPNRITLEQLSAKPLIFYRRFENLILSSIAREGRKPVVFCKNDDARTSLMWANAGLGVAVVPQSITRNNLHGNTECRIIDHPDLYTSIAAVWKKDAFLSGNAKKFLEEFRA